MSANFWGGVASSRANLGSGLKVNFRSVCTAQSGGKLKFWPKFARWVENCHAVLEFNLYKIQRSKGLIRRDNSTGSRINYFRQNKN